MPSDSNDLTRIDPKFFDLLELMLAQSINRPKTLEEVMGDPYLRLQDSFPEEIEQDIASRAESIFISEVSKKQHRQC